MTSQTKTKRIHTNSWFWIGIFAIAITGYSMISSAFKGPVDPCGLGPPPDGPGFAAAQERERAEVKENGFRRVCEADLKRYDMSFESMSKALKDLAFSPVELGGTPFAQLKPLGGMAESVSDTRSRLYRGFEMPGGHTVTLFEHDMSADGSGMWRDPADETERINGLPARLTVLQAGTGKGVSHLSWTEGRRYYELWLDANVAKSPLREQLFALAGSLPKSTPACPNRPQPKPVVRGPDGFPAMEPMPERLTEAEMEAWAARMNPPCS